VWLAVLTVFPLIQGSMCAQGVRTLRIMCVGDGITVGYTDNPSWTIPFEFGYRSGLYSRLMTNAYSVQFVGSSPEPWNGNFGLPTNTPSPDLRSLDQDHHNGYAGLSTAGALGSMALWLAADGPDVVLLMVGTDDSNIPTATSNVTSVVQTIIAKSQAAVIVAQIPPSINYSQFVIDYNRFIRETLVASYQSYGNRVTTVDQYTNFLANGAIDPTLFASGLHPNNVAYDRMAQTWYNGIQSVLPSTIQVRFIALTALAGNVVLTGSGGPPNGNFYVLTTTNPALPLSNWLTNAQAGTFDTTGSFSYTNSLPAGVLSQFFRLRL